MAQDEKAPVEAGKIEIIKWDGKPIKRNGLYAMSLAAYHSHNCEGPSISSSGLRTIEQKSPAHYWFDSYLNPRREIDEEQKAHFSIGSAAHTLLLSEEGFRDAYIVRPTQYDSWRTQASKDWRDEQIRLGRTVLIPADINAIRGMASALDRDPIIKAGLFNGLTEKSLIWKDEETGIWLKARPDTISADAATIVDLKTIAEADRHSCESAIWNYGYHMQLGLAGMGMKAVLGRDIDNSGHVIAFVEKAAPWCVNVKIIDAEAIMWGAMLCRRALRTFADCWAKKEWPGYADSGNNISLPKWLNDRLREEHKNGALG